MPKDLTVNLGTGNVNKIRYTYDASGMKLRKQAFNNGNTSTALMDYVQGIEYNNGVIEAIPHSNGRAVYNGSTWRYEFNVTDHLGNVRAVISDLDNDKILDFTGSSTTNEVINSYTYYPFGMVFGNNSPANNTTTPDTKYQYNGKEFNSDLGLNLLDYGARWYDPAIGRFTGVDPLAEKMADWAPFNYTFNNPIKYTDPDGRNPVLGFLIGFGTELAIQKLTGQELSMTKALVSGGAGALSGGLSTAKNIGTIGKLILGATIDATESVSKQVIDGNGIDGKQVFSDVIMSGAAGQAKVVDNANMKVLENTADRTKRIAAGDPASSNRALRATGAKIELNVAKGSNQVAGSVAGDAAQTVSDAIRSNPEKNPIMIKSYEMTRDNTNVVKIH